MPVILSYLLWFSIEWNELARVQICQNKRQFICIYIFCLVFFLSYLCSRFFLSKEENSIIIIIAPRDSESSFCILIEKRINQTQFILKIELGDDEVVFTRHQKNEVWTTFTQIDERMYNKRMRCNNITYINRNDDVVFFHVTGNNKWIWIYSALLHWRV